MNWSKKLLVVKNDIEKEIMKSDDNIELPGKGEESFMKLMDGILTERLSKSKTRSK